MKITKIPNKVTWRWLVSYRGAHARESKQCSKSLKFLNIVTLHCKWAHLCTLFLPINQSDCSISVQNQPTFKRVVEWTILNHSCTLYWYKTATFTLTSLQFTSSFSSFRKHLSWQDRVVQCKTCGCIWLNGELSARAAASVMHSTPIYTCLQAKSDWCRLGAVQFYWIYIGIIFKITMV